ncbi:MAG: response regulator [Dissulfurispiraceae bacterium]|jgi:two-component system, chemotaxis family, chemotaxis protein CheY
MNILVIDDVSAMRAFIRAGIKVSFRENVQIEEADSGESAMKELQNRRYDLILCDWNMPGIKGTELLQWVREQNDLKAIPFIMLTAHNEKDIVMEAMKLGVNDYITKPITIEILTKKLRPFIKE